MTEARAKRPSASPSVATLRRELGAPAFRLLGAVCLEGTLEERALLAFAADAPAVERQSKVLLTRGLVSRVPATAWGNEPGLRATPAWRQLVLRDLSAHAELEDLVRDCHQLLESRSQAPLELALQRGALTTFRKLRSAQPVRLRGHLRTDAEWLRQTLCQPFDGAWLEATFGEDAVDMAEIVLTDALWAFADVDGLDEWFAARVRQLDDSPSKQTRLRVSAEHRVLRAKSAALRSELLQLSPGLRSACEICLAFLEGERGRAQALLAQASTRIELELGALAPILALLIAADGTPAALSRARRLMGKGRRSDQKAAARGFKALVAHLTDPQSHARRLDPHQIGRSGSAWELLLSGVAVELHVHDEVTRAVWAEQLGRAAAEWHAAGYLFVAQQGAALAQRFDGRTATRALQDVNVELPAQTLWSGLEAKPEWEKALLRLGQLSRQLEHDAERHFRVAWFVDMTDGELSRPALQEYRSDQGAWTQGRRLSWGSLYAVRDQLPIEDVRVLDCSTETLSGEREPTPEAVEALIGHPRVYNGVRQLLSVTVLRGRARVEAREAAGQIRVVVEPAGARAGVNVSVEAEDRLRVYRVSDELARVLEALPNGVAIPKSHEAELLEVLGKLSLAVDVVSPELGIERDVEADSTPIARVAPHAGAFLVQFGVRPFGTEGRFFVAGQGRRRIQRAERGRRARCQRDLRRERQSVDELIAACASLPAVSDDSPSELDPPDSWMLGEEELLALFSDLGKTELVHRVEWPEAPLVRLRGTASSHQLQGQLRCIKGWYLARGEVKLSDVDAVSLEQLARAAPIGLGRFVRLEAGEYVEVEGRVRRILAALRGAARPRGTGLSVHRGALSTLSQLAAPESGFDVDGETTAWLERVRRLQHAQFPVPANLNAELRDYQRTGYEWLSRLAELGLGACLADDMGLGKTLQIIALLLARPGRALVVAPTSVCLNWAREIARFAPDLRVLEYLGKRRSAELDDFLGAGPGVVITSYALLQQDAHELAQPEWDAVVLDEAQFIKNASSLRAKAAYGLNARVRIVATGTPLENHLGDIWSLFRFLNPGLLGDWKSFRREFLRPIEQDRDETVREELRRRLEPYVLRREKTAVAAELPALTEIVHEVRFSDDEKLRYALLRKQIHEKLFGPGRRENKLEVLAEITRLRRFCCHQRLIFPDAEPESAKVTAFLDLAEELAENRHRALVFSQYVDFLSLVREELDERQIGYEYLDGSVPKAERQRRVDAFQAGDRPLFLISLKAGGFGLNLTAADYVIHLDPWWNPAVEAQATDRAHRIGQERPVTVYRLLVRDSIEESVTELHARKRELAAALLDGSDRVAELDTESLIALLDHG